MARRNAQPASEAQRQVVVTLPRSRRRGESDALAARRRKQRAQKASEDEGARAHGWGRAEDPDARPRTPRGLLQRRRANGTPLLLFTVLAVLTAVGLARVSARIEVLQAANEITELSEQQKRLLDRKRRLETERAYLRRPERVAEQAAARLGMVPAPPTRIQRIELEPAADAGAAHETGATR
ncbi:hypothetical protein G6O69_15575 [Pseudenhygromyxa sp. WMMC2535]|uniref:hypothetical protein n=1 Tax=Pseudenhygromyxa sp. WMMC2535 TaxID=2712867 RepID=UPI0015531978|nr:hypothetical protein [Pseudenhygromyxa sp. WMMC2535]NVB39263.1 hypothetical protein [Pseudenhygromyxa sp. WMMC2535]